MVTAEKGRKTTCGGDRCFENRRVLNFCARSQTAVPGGTKSSLWDHFGIYSSRISVDGFPHQCLRSFFKG